MLTIRTADDFEELAAHPERVREANSATVVASTGSVVTSIAMFKEFVEKPGALAEFVEALIEQEAEEDMVSAWPKDTGLDNAIKIIPGNQRHGPRIKVAIDPPNRFVEGGLAASIPFGEDEIRAPIPADVVPRKVELQLRRFIELNRAVLLAVDRSPEEGGISGIALGSVLKKIG
jgi:hypothetical protein